MDDLVTISEAAELCSVKPSTLRAYDSRGEPKKCPFPPADSEVRIGNRIVRYWKPSVVLEWNKRRTAKNADRVELKCRQIWIDRAARISGAIPPDDWRRVVRIETISRTDGADLIGVVGWWQRRTVDGMRWIDDSTCRHSAVRGDMWYRRMTFLADA